MKKTYFIPEISVTFVSESDLIVTSLSTAVDGDGDGRLWGEGAN